MAWKERVYMKLLKAVDGGDFILRGRERGGRTRRMILLLIIADIFTTVSKPGTLLKMFAPHSAINGCLYHTAPPSKLRNKCRSTRDGKKDCSYPEVLGNSKETAF